MDDSLKGKNVVIDISDGASDDDGHSDDDRYGDDDGYGVDDGLDDYRLDELTEEDVYEMIFDSDEDGERFYNAYAKVKGFSAAGWSTNPNSVQAQILSSNFGGWSTIPGNGSEG
ncbi:uncharacterized protein LOC131326593 [Rhododendron vialii]|uniref:uncharacterized protein LOC131326593 n=1 Tax=Rhododendron vialii TaxID=182163 RepID=UPI00265F2D70|nr:uncharacterized protein LOC131326593 [Rhododendron vialii]